MVTSPEAIREWATLIGVEIALALTGITSARLGHAPVVPAMVRNMLVGSLGMGVTYLVGTFFAA